LNFQIFEREEKLTFEKQKKALANTYQLVRQRQQHDSLQTEPACSECVCVLATLGALFVKISATIQ